MDRGPSVVDIVCSREEIALLVEAIDRYHPAAVK
jgi:hypothetical protein